MLSIIRKPIIFLISLCMVFCLASCGEKDSPAVEYGDHTEYAGIWHSEPGDDRAFVLGEDGTYQMYSVKPGKSPELAEQGIFKVRGSTLYLAQDSDGESFDITGQLTIFANGKLSLNYTDFERISGDTDPALLEELTAMIVPLESYMGEWENDTVYVQLTIDEAGYNLNEVESVSSGTYIIGRDCLLIGMSYERQKLTATDDGGLELSGMEGVFYPAGSGRGAASPFAPFAGTWGNSATGQVLQVTEEGAFALSHGSGFAGGGCSVKDGVLSFSDYTAALSGGKLIVSGIDGVFEKQ